MLPTGLNLRRRRSRLPGQRAPCDAQGAPTGGGDGARTLLRTRSEVVATIDPETGVVPGVTRDRKVRSSRRCSMCPAIHITSRSWLRSSSTHEPSDPPLRVVCVSLILLRLLSTDFSSQNLVYVVYQAQGTSRTDVAAGPGVRSGGRRQEDGAFSLNLALVEQGGRAQDLPLLPAGLSASGQEGRDGRYPPLLRGRVGPDFHTSHCAHCLGSVTCLSPLRLGRFRVGTFSPRLVSSLVLLVSLGNDPSAGSPTETLLRLLLPLNDQVRSSSRQHRRAPVKGHARTHPRISLSHSIGSSDGRCVQRAGT